MSAAARAAGIADVDDIGTANDPSRDIELGPNSHYLPRHSTSRASIPLSRTRSFSTLGGGRGRADSQGRRPSTTYGEGNEAYNEDPEANGATGQEGEIAWGPSHPCFPHMNPHVPQSSPLYEKTRIIRIRRDWMVAGDLAPAFSRVYPEILEPCLAEADFRNIVDHINTALLRAYDPWRPRAWVDAALGLLTGWIYDDLGFSGMKAEMKALEQWVAQWNETQGAKEGVTIISLRRTAFLSLDLQIPDPQIGVEGGADAASFMDGASSVGTDARFSRALNGNVGQTAGSVYSSVAGNLVAGVTEDEQPAVPAIPGKYMDEAREAVGRQLQRGVQE